MNYVIQNFLNNSFFIINTPRSRLLYLTFKINKINFLIKISQFCSFFFFYFHKFSLYFYNKQLIYIFKKFTFEFINFYENNLFKSAMYWNLISLLNNKTFKIFFLSRFFFFKKILLPVKAVNLKLTGNLYKNIFFFLLKTTLILWNSYYLNYKIYLNFLIINENFFILPNYYGYFLNIYHY